MADLSIHASTGSAPGLAQASAVLTDDKKAFISDLLSGYDLKNLSKSDHEGIRAALKAEGITPSRALGEELRNQGLAPSAEARRSSGPPPGGPPPGAGSGSDDDEELTFVEQILEDILNGQDVQDLSDSERQSLEASLKEAVAQSATGRALDLSV